MSAAKLVRRRVTDVAFKAFCILVTVLALAALAAILWSLLSQGLGGINLYVFTKRTMSTGSHGGLANAIIGSIEMCLLAMVIALTLGVLAGTWLAEYGGNTPYAQVVRFLNDVLLSAPSILVGLFVYQILVAPFHGYSGYAGAVALAMLATPVVTRTTEDILNLQPSALREAGMALGASRAFVIRNIMWKSARTGLVTGGLLGFARISGETAPLIFTSLGNQFMNTHMSQPMASLPTVIYNFGMSAYDDWQRLAWVGALLIAIAVLSINIIGRVLAREQHR